MPFLAHIVVILFCSYHTKICSRTSVSLTLIPTSNSISQLKIQCTLETNFVPHSHFASHYGRKSDKPSTPQSKPLGILKYPELPQFAREEAARDLGSVQDSGDNNIPRRQQWSIDNILPSTTASRQQHPHNHPPQKLPPIPHPRTVQTRPTNAARHAPVSSP